MRRILVLLLTLPVILLSCKKTNRDFYSSYPKVKAVVAEFEKRIKVEQDEFTFLELAKKPKGWYIIRRNRADQKVFGEYLFWNSKTGHYETPDGIKAPKPVAPGSGKYDQISNALQSSYQFDHQIYFGYDTWADDILADLEGADLNDTLTESLARAYAHKSMEIIRPTGKKKNSTGLSAKEIDEFMSWCDKEISTYEKLNELNPSYQTIVGTPDVKIGNTNMYAWSELNMIGAKDKAAKYLRDNLYNEVLLGFAKNMLQSAEPNAIIVTWGDNDTYPLWYQQEKLGLRKDIVVINSSLANIGEWLAMWNRNYSLGMQIDQRFYNDSLSEYGVFSDSPGTSAIAFSELASDLNRKSPALFTSSASGKQLIFPSKTFRLNAASDTNEFHASYNRNSYIFRGDLAIMDIIASNYGKRPFYFANMGSDFGIKGAVNSSLMNEGLLDKVVPLAALKGENYAGDIFNRELLKKNLTGTYVYPISKPASANYMTDNYFYLFNSLVNLELQANDTAAAKKALAFMDNKLVPEKNAGPNILAFIAKGYIAAGDKNRGEQLLGLSVDAIRSGFEKRNTDTDDETYLQWLDYIISNAETNGMTVVRDKATGVRNQIQSKQIK